MEEEAYPYIIFNTVNFSYCNLVPLYEDDAMPQCNIPENNKQGCFNFK